MIIQGVNHIYIEPTGRNQNRRLYKSSIAFFFFMSDVSINAPPNTASTSQNTYRGVFFLRLPVT